MSALIRLLDGEVLDFKEDAFCAGSGCETCNYGSSYVQDFTVVTTQGTWLFEVDNMYESAISHDFMFKTVLPKFKEFEAMTVGNFIAWLAATIQAESPDSFKLQKVEVVR